MLKVLFADDEPLMLEGLRYLVDWDQLGFEVCGEAMDGEDALQLIHRTRPDLVITDVRMPVINGLELIESLYESDFQVKFIIFSGYADFEYAMKALKYGVSNYLTKPLDENELEQAVQAVASQIRTERELLERREAVSALMETETVSSLLMRENTPEEVKAGLSALDIHPGSRICCVLVNGVSLGEPHLRGSRLLKVDDDSPVKHVTAYSFAASIDKLGYLLISPQEGPGLNRAVIEEWIDILRAREPRPVTFSVSREHIGTEHLNMAYQEALTANICHTGTDQRDIHHFCEQDKDEMAMLPAGLKKSLIQSVTAGNTEGLISQVRDIFKIFSDDITSKAWIDAYLTHIKADLLHEIKARGGDAPAWEKKWFPPKVSASRLLLLEQQTAEDLREAAEWFAAADRSRDDLVVASAVEYIRTNYRDKLKLQDIAGHLHVNSAYLGQRIKKQYGSSFNELLHQIRIEEAKKLLRRTDMNISDVAELVGYSDADMFTAKFKVLNGISPSLYKKG